MRCLLASAGLLLFTASVASAEVPAPRISSVTDMAQLETPLPTPYDSRVDADAAVAATIARAKASGKRVLIDLGGNWCTDCRILAAVMELPELKAFVAEHYEVVEIDVGRMNKNMQIPARYGVTKLEGVPTVLIVEPDGKLINATNAADLADARSMNPQGIANWLARWAK
ncbi:MAG: thiol reductase thioredoxin [Alphaproteobacteria bacterium]|nr:thiol reductase thioredoxin [Alphaproteobacteria bacterium]